jgi:hypothetical protein
MMSDPQVLIEPKPIPPEIDRWNWGAFLLNWIWGVGNNTFIGLLTLIPVFGSPPAQRRGDVLEDRLDDVGVVVDAELVGHRQQ